MPPDVQPAGGDAGAKHRAPGRAGSGAKLGGGRYEVEALSHRTAFGEVYRGRETSTGRAVSLHLFDDALVADAAAVDGLRKAVQETAALDHEALLRPTGLSAADGQVTLVTDQPEGHTLRQLLARKQETGSRGFHPRGAQNVLTQVVTALEGISHDRGHGALSLDSVIVDKSGRVRLTDLGLAPLAPAASRAGTLGTSIAPEVAKSGRAAPRADLYSVGAILYEILVGAPPVKGCPRPSQAVAGVSAAVDQIVGRCMAQDPARRPASLAQLKSALAQALAGSGSQETQAAAPAAQSGAPASSRPSLAQAITAPGASAERSAVEPNDALSAALSDTSERWLISKGKLDYGPFALAQVVEQIQKNQVLPHHTIVDNHTGERQKLEDHPLLSDLVEEAKLRRDEQRRAQAESVAVKQEKRRGLTLYVFVGLGVLALGGGAYFIVDKLSSDDGGESASIASLEESSVSISASSVKAEKKGRAGRRGGRRGGSKGGGGSGGGAAGWDDPLDLGDVSEGGGGGERLSDAQINPVIQKHSGRLGRCMLSSGSRRAHIKFIIKGSGRVSWASVNGKRSGALFNCLNRAIKGMKFPSFDGIRTRATFDINL